MIGNLLIIVGSLSSLVGIVVRYLMPLWPAEGVDPNKINFHLEILLYSGAVLAITGAFLIARKTASRSRQIRILILSGVVLALASVSVFTGNPQASLTNMSGTSTGNAKYHFTSDWVSEHTAIWTGLLAELKGKPDIHALEVGSFEGRSALWFLENILTDPTSTITCIDIYVDAYEKTFDDNMKAYGQPGKVVKLKSYSDDALRKLKPQSYDFIYIDGSHLAKDVLSDAVLAWDLLKPGGIMIFDDYNQAGIKSWLWVNYTPKIAIDAFVNVFGPYFELLHKDYQLAIEKKDPKQVDLETFKPLRSFVIGVQRLAG